MTFSDDGRRRYKQDYARPLHAVAHPRQQVPGDVRLD